MTRIDGYRYIIIGAGSAGCVLAHHLSADPQSRVLLLEAGPRDWHPLIHIPLEAPDLARVRRCLVPPAARESGSGAARLG